MSANQPAGAEAGRPGGGDDIEGAPLLSQKQLLETEASHVVADGGNGLFRRLGRACWHSGATCVGVAAFLFAFQASLVKVVTPHGIPVFQIVVIRSVLSMAVTFVTAFAKGIHPIYGRLRNWPILASRGLVGAAAMTVFYLSLVRLPLADSVTIIFCNPAICSVLAWLLLGESFGLLTVFGCLASLGGVVLVARPPFLFGDAPGTHDEWTHDRALGMLFAVSGAFLTSGAYLAIRVIGKREPSITIAMWFHTSAALSNGIPLLAGYPDSPVMPGAIDWLCLVGIGCCSFLAQLLLNRGFQIQVAAKSAAVNYTQVLYAYVWGAVFFHEGISLLGVLGALLIAAGVITVNADKSSSSQQKGAGAAVKEPAGPAGTAVGAVGRAGEYQLLQQAQHAQQAAEGEPEEWAQQGAEQQPDLYRDRHGRLKAKPSFKALPKQAGAQHAQQQGGVGSGGSVHSWERHGPGSDRISSGLERGLLPAHRGGSSSEGAEAAPGLPHQRRPLQGPAPWGASALHGQRLQGPETLGT